MKISSNLQPLAEIAAEHPSFFGESRVIEPQPFIIKEDATVLPRITVSEDKDWSLRFSQGIFDANGDHIQALSDQRAHRKLFYPASKLDQAAGHAPDNIKRLKFMLYGGTLYEHFGDMLVDTCRAYQLLRLYRYSKEPIWFHYAVPRSIKSLRAPYIEAWLHCIGLGQRFLLIRRPMRAKRLVSCPQIYRDLRFISSDYPAAARSALHPQLRKKLDEIKQEGRRIAYFSRHKLTQGTSKFTQEPELVEKLRSIPEIDIICPEELNFEQKLAIWRSHAYIVGFPQGCMMLKPFVATNDTTRIARQIFLVAGPESFPSTWLNVEKACGFGDLYLDCHYQNETPTEDANPTRFTRANSIDVDTVVLALKDLAASLH